MTYSLDYTRSPFLFTLVVVTAVFCARVSCADLGFRCYFADMITTTTPDGETLEFCPTQTHPPVMSKGDYLVVVTNGTCYECMCASDTGLACCECPRPRRGR